MDSNPQLPGYMPIINLIVGSIMMPQLDIFAQSNTIGMILSKFLCTMHLIFTEWICNPPELMPKSRTGIMISLWQWTCGHDSYMRIINMTHQLPPKAYSKGKCLSRFIIPLLSFLCLMLLQSHHRDSFFNGLVTFSSLDLILSFQTLNHEEILYENSLISHPSHFHIHAFASWQTLCHQT